MLDVLEFELRRHELVGATDTHYSQKNTFHLVERIEKYLKCQMF